MWFSATWRMLRGSASTPAHSRGQGCSAFYDFVLTTDTIVW
jgi:hypothetical protein